MQISCIQDTRLGSWGAGSEGVAEVSRVGLDLEGVVPAVVGPVVGLGVTAVVWLSEGVPGAGVVVASEAVTRPVAVTGVGESPVWVVLEVVGCTVRLEVWQASGEQQRILIW